METTGEIYVTAWRASEILGRTRQRVHQLGRSGVLATRREGGTVLYRLADVERVSHEIAASGRPSKAAP